MKADSARRDVRREAVCSLSFEDALTPAGFAVRFGVVLARLSRSPQAPHRPGGLSAFYRIPTEILYGVGAFDRVVGVSTILLLSARCDEAAACRRVGQQQHRKDFGVCILTWSY